VGISGKLDSLGLAVSAPQSIQRGRGRKQEGKGKERARHLLHTMRTKRIDFLSSSSTNGAAVGLRIQRYAWHTVKRGGTQPRGTSSAIEKICAGFSLLGLAQHSIPRQFGENQTRRIVGKKGVKKTGGGGEEAYKGEDRDDGEESSLRSGSRRLGKIRKRDADWRRKKVDEHRKGGRTEKRRLEKRSIAESEERVYLSRTETCYDSPERSVSDLKRYAMGVRNEERAGEESTTRQEEQPVPLEGNERTRIPKPV